MSKQIYTLKVQIAEFPKGSVVVHDTDWNEWYIGDKSFGVRGSVAEGEMCVLLNFLAEKNFTSMLEKVDDEE